MYPNVFNHFNHFNDDDVEVFVVLNFNIDDVKVFVILNYDFLNIFFHVEILEYETAGSKGRCVGLNVERYYQIAFPKCCTSS